MKPHRNHEGYHDPTAGKAIRRAHRARRQGRQERGPLCYPLGEVKGFRTAVDTLGLAERGVKLWH